jgi:hypothetical protein
MSLAEAGTQIWKFRMMILVYLSRKIAQKKSGLVLLHAGCASYWQTIEARDLLSKHLNFNVSGGAPVISLLQSLTLGAVLYLTHSS